MSGETKNVGESEGSKAGNSRALEISDENIKSCWVCFATEADDRMAAWVQPCKCIGTTKWVSIVLLYPVI